MGLWRKFIVFSFGGLFAQTDTLMAIGFNRLEMEMKARTDSFEKISAENHHKILLMLSELESIHRKANEEMAHEVKQVRMRLAQACALMFGKHPWRDDLPREPKKFTYEDRQ